MTIQNFDPAMFYLRVRKDLFNGRLSSGQFAGLQRLLDAWADHGDMLSPVGDSFLAYMLATSKWETGGRMQPVRETYAESDAQAMSRLETAYRAGKLKWVKTPYWRDGWFGRGDIQLTHEANYAGKIRDAVLRTFGVDIHKNPDTVLRPDISAFILIEGMTNGLTGDADFTKYGLEDFIRPGAKPDFLNARKVVNPADEDSYKPIAKDAYLFLSAIRDARAAWKAQDAFPAEAGVLPAPVKEDAPAPVPVPVAAPAAPTDEFAELYDGKEHSLLRTIQTQLRAAGYPEVGATDGKWGNRTASAITAYKRDNGMVVSDTVDKDFIAALAVAKPREVSAERASTTADKLVAMDDTQTKAGLNIAQLGKWAVILGPLVGITDGVLSVDEIPARINDVKAMGAILLPLLPYAALTAGGYLAWRYGRKLVEDAVTAYRSGRKL